MQLIKVCKYSNMTSIIGYVLACYLSFPLSLRISSSSLVFFLIPSVPFPLPRCFFPNFTPPSAFLCLRSSYNPRSLKSRMCFHLSDGESRLLSKLSYSIAIAKSATISLANIWEDRSISFQTKQRLLQSLVFSISTYRLLGAKNV